MCKWVDAIIYVHQFIVSAARYTHVQQGQSYQNTLADLPGQGFVVHVLINLLVYG